MYTTKHSSLILKNFVALAFPCLFNSFTTPSIVHRSIISVIMLHQILTKRRQAEALACSGNIVCSFDRIKKKSNLTISVENHFCIIKTNSALYFLSYPATPSSSSPSTLSNMVTSDNHHAYAHSNCFPDTHARHFGRGLMYWPHLFADAAFSLHLGL